MAEFIIKLKPATVSLITQSFMSMKTCMCPQRFHGRWIWRGAPQHWLLHPDLSRRDLRVGRTKDLVCQQQVGTRDALFHFGCCTQRKGQV